MPIERILGAMIKLQRSLSELYVWLSELFQSDEEASGLFYLLSIKENSHANAVNLHRRLTTRSSECHGRSDLSLQEIENLQQRIEGLRKTSSPLRLSLALNLVLGLKRDAVEKFSRPALAHAPEECRRLMGALMGDDLSQIKMLTEMLESRVDLQKAS